MRTTNNIKNNTFTEVHFYKNVLAQKSTQRGHFEYVFANTKKTEGGLN